MQAYHPAAIDRISAGIEKDTELNSSSELCALPRLMTQKDLAVYLHKSQAWCERARWAGDGPRFVKLGRHVRYRADDILAWIEENARTSTTAE